MGELKKLQRMVQRRDLKTQIKLLKQIITTHQPLIKAMQITAKAYTDGKLAGAQEMAAKIQEAEQEKLTAEAAAKLDTLMGEAIKKENNVTHDVISSVPVTPPDAHDHILQAAVAPEIEEFP
jgi:hypothetical protein